MPDPRRFAVRFAPIVLAALLLAVSVASASAQQRERESGYQESVRLENEQVRVLDLHYSPGAASPLHAHHFPRVVYVVEGGVLELESDTGTRARVELTAGQTLWRPAETHTVRNVGNSRVRVVEVEVKSSPGNTP